MDETSIEVAIEYDSRGGRIILSGLEVPLVQSIKKKLGAKKKVTLQQFEEGFLVSPEGVFFSSGDPSEHRIGYA